MTHSVWIATDTLGYPAGGGHLWAYLNWALGLQDLGCDVVWMESYHGPDDEAALHTLAERLDGYGLNRICLFAQDGGNGTTGCGATVAVEEAESADLLLNLAYGVPGPLVARFARSALLDIDPGMTQTWIAAGNLELAPHDIYLTTGEGVATRAAPVPDCGLRWLYAPPCVAVDSWTVAPPPAGGTYTTVTHWWGDSFVTPDGQVIDNTKRASFLRYLTVPRSAGIKLDLAVSADDLEDDAQLLSDHGWSFTDPLAAAGTLERYRSYIVGSRGEFSCAKPAFVALNTGWISDRTVCYLATGRPVIVEDTGPCELLELAEGQGVFRFSDPAGAAAALAEVEQDHSRQCALARSVAEECFDARRSAARVLELCLS